MNHDQALSEAAFHLGHLREALVPIYNDLAFTRGQLNGTGPKAQAITDVLLAIKALYAASHAATLVLGAPR